MKSHNSIYSFSFTAANALIHETVVVAEKYITLGNWDATFQVVLKNNLLSKIKEATIKREFQEISKRLGTLTEQQLQLVASGESNTVKAMLFLSLMKTYVFIYEFVTEAMRAKYLAGDTLLLDSDYQNFINSKLGHHPELKTLSKSTSDKVKQVLLRMLSQLGFLSSPRERIILRPILSPTSISAIKKDNVNYFKLFMYSDNEIERIIK